jgi:hypothetical protein
MAGGKITRIVGGKLTKEIEGDYTICTDNYTINSGGKISFTSDEEIIFGSPPPPPAAGKYFDKGWWSSDFAGNNKITNAKIGDTVYFHVEMTKDFPETDLAPEKQKNINFKLYEFDGNYYKIKNIYFSPTFPPLPIPDIEKKPKKDKEQEIHYVTWIDKDKDGVIDDDEKDSKKPYTQVEVKGNNAVISFRLEEALSKYYNGIGELKLFMSVSYATDTDVDLPEDEGAYLDVKPKPPIIKEIYVRLLNYQIPITANLALAEIEASQQFIRGNDDSQSASVNLDYFSVRIDKMPKVDGGALGLYRLIKERFLKLASGHTDFKGHATIPSSINMGVSGLWKFRAYPKEDEPMYENIQAIKWDGEIDHPIFYIEADSNDWYAQPVVDDGAVIVSEFSDMCWLFTTINTSESDTQPFSGHRQFGIYLHEDGFYRVFTRALDRVWPKDGLISPKSANFGEMDATVKDYFSIANGTWNYYMNEVSKFITDLGGSATIMPPEVERINFADFNSEFTTAPNLKVGNIPQEKVYEK